MNAAATFTPPEVDFAAEGSAAADMRLRLRVLRGRSAGAEHRLPTDRILTIGHSFENDIVLRGKSTRGCALELTVDRDGRLTVEVVAGQAIVLGRPLSPGEPMQLAPYLPVTIGDFSFAVGRGDDSRWDEATANVPVEVADPSEAVAVPRTDLAERITLRSAPVQGWLSGLGGRPALLAAFGAALVAGVAAAVFGASLLPPSSGTPGAMQRELAAAGFPSLGIATDRGGTLAITGLVKDDSALSRLRAWAATNAPGSRVAVETIDGMAAAANDLLAAQNVDATARAAGSASLVIDGPFLPSDRKRELAALIRRDLPLVNRIDFRADPGRGKNDLAYFFNSPGYGAASFVDGDPGYIVTEDGSRWFAGALLPTGHRITSIGSGTLTVERDGLQDSLTM